MLYRVELLLPQGRSVRPTARFSPGEVLYWTGRWQRMYTAVTVLVEPG